LQDGGPVLVSSSLSTLSQAVSRSLLCSRPLYTKLTPRHFAAFYWIPSAALAAVIIEAVGGLVASPRQTYSYWLVSPLECIIFIAAVLITFFTTIEIGIYVSFYRLPPFNVLHELTLPLPLDSSRSPLPQLCSSSVLRNPEDRSSVAFEFVKKTRLAT
jgi:hypothetical protein